MCEVFCLVVEIRFKSSIVWVFLLKRVTRLVRVALSRVLVDSFFARFCALESCFSNLIFSFSSSFFSSISFLLSILLCLTASSRLLFLSCRLMISFFLASIVSFAVLESLSRFSTEVLKILTLALSFSISIFFLQFSV